MKGTIFEIKNKKAVALDSEGRFVNLKNKGYSVGEEVELVRTSSKLSYGKFATVAAAIAIVIILAASGIFGVVYYDTNVKTAYIVQMDINPSVTIFFNSKDVVIKAEGSNEDGATLNPNDFKGETLDGFMAKYIERFVESAIYDADATYTVKIVVDGKTKATAVTKDISARVESIVREDFEKKGIAVTTQTENGVKEAEPTRWTYSCYNTLLSDNALSTEKLYDGDIIIKPSDSPSAGDSNYTYVFWWDGVTKEDSGMPIDFFAGGEKTISKDTELFAVWTFKNGYTIDGNTWLVEPTRWTYSCYNTLLSDNALSTEKLYDGDIIIKPSDSPSAGDSNYTYVFWWDGVTKEDSGMPIDFFAGGEKIISKETELFAVWTFKNGYTIDGNTWLVEPTRWTYSCYNTLLSDNALSTEKLYDGDIIIKPSDSPSAGDSNYTYVFWWDGVTKEDSGMPIDFFAGGNKTITKDIELFAVWKTDAGAHTCDGKTWIVYPEKVNVQFVLVYPYEAKMPDEVLSKGDVSSIKEMEPLRLSSEKDIAEKLKEAKLSGTYKLVYWSLTRDGSSGDYFGTANDLVANIVLYAVLKQV